MLPFTNPIVLQLPLPALPLGKVSTGHSPLKAIPQDQGGASPSPEHDSSKGNQWYDEKPTKLCKISGNTIPISIWSYISCVHISASILLKVDFKKWYCVLCFLLPRAHIAFYTKLMRSCILIEQPTLLAIDFYSHKCSHLDHYLASYPSVYYCVYLHVSFCPLEAYNEFSVDQLFYLCLTTFWNKPRH